MTDMTDDEMDERIRKLAQGYRDPVEIRSDVMWAKIQEGLARSPVIRAQRAKAMRRRRVLHWPALGMAAVLMLSVGIGVGSRMELASSRATAGSRAMAVTLPDPRPASFDDAYLTRQLTGARHVLTSFQGDARTGGADPAVGARAQVVLDAIRQLINDGADRDPRYAHLLRDLTLVLSQISACDAAPGDHRQHVFAVDRLIEDERLVGRLEQLSAPLGAATN